MVVYCLYLPNDYVIAKNPIKFEKHEGGVERKTRVFTESQKRSNLHLALIVSLLDRLAHTQETRCKENIKGINSDNEKLPQSDEKTKFPLMSPKTLTFHELCDIINSRSDWSERDLALKTIAKSKLNNLEQEQLIFDLSINLLRSTNITCHRTAAQVLAALPKRIRNQQVP